MSNALCVWCLPCQVLCLMPSHPDAFHVCFAACLVPTVSDECLFVALSGRPGGPGEVCPRAPEDEPVCQHHQQGEDEEESLHHGQAQDPPQEGEEVIQGQTGGCFLCLFLVWSWLSGQRILVCLYLVIVEGQTVVDCLCLVVVEGSGGYWICIFSHI